VFGVTEIQRIFGHMYAVLEAPYFVVTDRMVDGHQCFLTWEFRFRFRRFNPKVDQTVRGGSHLKLTSDGRIHYHRDYWDAAEELYEKLPLLNRLMHWLKQKINH
jgi:steroid Delta-isomerase